nr:COX15/CtaA family protein [Corynebacterium mustelae]
MSEPDAKSQWSSRPSIILQRRLALLLLIAQGGITVTGSIVRVTGSGLGCNTWPNCHEGSLVPVQGAAPAVHQAIEFGNRLLTFVLVAFAVAVFIAVLLARRRREVIVHAVIQGLGIVVQAVIGGISVLLDLKWWSVALHFLPSMFLVWMAAMLYIRIQELDSEPQVRTYSRAMRFVVSVFALGIAAVLVTGTMVTGAGVHSGDSGVGMEGRLEVDIELMAYIHAGTMYFFLAVLLLLFTGLVMQKAPARVRKTGWILIAMILFQIAVGIFQFRMGVPRWTVPVHVAMSSVIVAFSSFLYAIGMVRTVPDNPKSTTGSIAGDEKYFPQRYPVSN